MQHIHDYKNFKTVHQLKRRIRIVAFCLLKDIERAYIFQILLLKREAIEEVKVVSEIGSVTIHFDPELLPASNLLQLLEVVLGNIGNKPQNAIKDMRQKQFDASKPIKTIHFAVQGMSCSSCALYLEIVLKRDPGIAFAHVNFINETAYVRANIKKQAIFEIIKQHGYRAFSLDTKTERKMMLEREQQHMRSAKKHLLIIAGLSLPVSLLGIISRRSFTVHLLQAILTTPVIVYGAHDIFNKALKLAKQGTASMESLLTIGVGSAYSYSIFAMFRRNQHVYFESATGIILFVLLGRYLEQLAKRKIVESINKLTHLKPEQATLFNAGDEQKIAVDEIKCGDILLIRPGERIPADGVVLHGLSAVDEASVTGVSVPCIKEKGQALFEGSINGSGVMQMRTTATGAETILSGLMHLVEEAQASGLSVQKTVDRVAAIFVPAILSLSVVTFAGWRFAGQGVAHALANAVSVLVIACPCSLGLATPSATMVSTSQAARRGVYIRNSAALESTAAITAIVFDKTGTLTKGHATVSEMLNISALDDQRLLQLAASAEFNSEHFLGKAIIDYANKLSISRLETSHFVNVPDQGIRCKVINHEIVLGNENWLKEKNIDLTALSATAEKLAGQGKTLVYMAIDNQASALFAITDDLRPGAAAVIAHLHGLHIQTQLVTGDTPIAANHVAMAVGIDKVTALAGPAQKMRIIRHLQEQGHHVAMLGDGINDAPALAAADVGMAVGTGTGIAIETADLILLNGDIAKVADALQLSQQTMQIIRQNLFWSFSYNAFAIPIAAFGKLNPLVASAAMAFSSISVIANALRLNRK